MTIRYFVAVLELAILGLLVTCDLHGYELQKRVADLLGPGANVSFGSLYPALRRLERDGVISSVAAGPSRRGDKPVPMSGSLGAELAAYRDRSKSGETRRGRKVYSITPAGRDQLQTLLRGDVSDNRTFQVQVAFCSQLDEPTRNDMLRRRRAIIAERLASRTHSDTPTDSYRRELVAFQNDRLRHELSWLDSLLPNISVTTEGDSSALVTPGGIPT